ncbi:hypothetical protein H4P12_13600 [Paracoccus sp. 11-3]|uniref:Uncharacterized protein n=1 Tax=Paracoccus amoyensis TaxID=2760093 RepID=A0A926GB03_9RHOB|nr:hypothetical protein [Paracoccus amoyensis]
MANSSSRNLPIISTVSGISALPAALKCAWDEPDPLTERQKELIRACLPADLIEDEAAPTREDQLEYLQRIVSACDEISKNERRMDEPEAQGRPGFFICTARRFF